MLFHLSGYFVLTVLTATAVSEPPNPSVFEIDLMSIAPAGANHMPAPVSDPQAAAPPGSRSPRLPLGNARPHVGRIAKVNAGRPAPEPGAGKNAWAGKAAMKNGRTSLEEESVAAVGGTEGTGSASSAGAGNDRPPGNGQETKNALAGYSRAVRALIEKNKEYPLAARRMGFQGSLIVSFSVNRHGELRSVSLVKTSGNSMLDNAGMRAVRAAGRFPSPPYQTMSGTEELSFRIPITFTLTAG